MIETEAGKGSKKAGLTPNERQNNERITREKEGSVNFGQRKRKKSFASWGNMKWIQRTVAFRESTSKYHISSSYIQFLKIHPVRSF